MGQCVVASVGPLGGGSCQTAHRRRRRSTATPITVTAAYRWCGWDVDPMRSTTVNRAAMMLRRLLRAVHHVLSPHATDRPVITGNTRAGGPSPTHYPYSARF